jgi:hypothetical protein
MAAEVGGMAESGKLGTGLDDSGERVTHRAGGLRDIWHGVAGGAVALVAILALCRAEAGGGAGEWQLEIAGCS